VVKNPNNDQVEVPRNHPMKGTASMEDVTRLQVRDDHLLKNFFQMILST